MPFACLDSNVWHPWIWVMLWPRSLGLMACLYQRKCLFSILLPLCPTLWAVMLPSNSSALWPIAVEGMQSWLIVVCTPVVVQEEEAEVAPARFPPSQLGNESHWAGALCCWKGSLYMIREKTQVLLSLWCSKTPFYKNQAKLGDLIESPALITHFGQSYSA